MNNVTLFGALLAGSASFFSPCVVPLMPIYLSYLTGSGIDELEEHPEKLRKTIMIHSAAFLFGLMIVFSILGLTATALGRFLYINANVFKKASGILIVLFGIHHAGFISLNALKKEKKFRIKMRKPRLINSVLIGMAFSFGWTPCVGPVLASILVIAANSASLTSGVNLLIAYSIGFSIPFFLSSFFLNEVLKRMDKAEKTMLVMKKATGVLLMLFGLLIYFGYLDQLVAKLY